LDFYNKDNRLKNKRSRIKREAKRNRSISIMIKEKYNLFEGEELDTMGDEEDPDDEVEEDEDPDEDISDDDEEDIPEE
jgi:hypothetical protein